MKPVKIDPGHRFRMLLTALALLLTAYPLIKTEGLTRVSFHAFFQFVLLVGLFSIRRARGWFTVGALLVTPPILDFWGELCLPDLALWRSASVQAASHVLTAAYLALLIVFVLRDLFSSREVTTDRLYGALSAYMLTALVFGSLYTALELVAPGSFSIAEGLGGVATGGEQKPLHSQGTLYYFSFISLTTVGFGDVSPSSATAQMIVMWESIVGQAFLTILVARLVGLHVAAGTENGASEEAGPG
ncbi:MAG: ion channel [Planctomycetota bacterium]